jgi:FixJ family two-component response regulator
LPGLSGLDLQRKLAAADCTIPIIFITGHGDIPMSLEAMKAGAVKFLTKPFRDRALLDAIHKAIRQNIIIRKHRGEIAELQWDFHTIKPTFLLFGRKKRSSDCPSPAGSVRFSS